MFLLFFAPLSISNAINLQASYLLDSTMLDITNISHWTSYSVDNNNQIFLVSMLGVLLITLKEKNMFSELSDFIK